MLLENMMQGDALFGITCGRPTAPYDFEVHVINKRLLGVSVNSSKKAKQGKHSQVDNSLESIMLLQDLDNFLNACIIKIPVH